MLRLVVSFKRSVLLYSRGGKSICSGSGSVSGLGCLKLCASCLRLFWAQWLMPCPLSPSLQENGVVVAYSSWSTSIWGDNVVRLKGNFIWPSAVEAPDFITDVCCAMFVIWQQHPWPQAIAFYLDFIYLCWPLVSLTLAPNIAGIFVLSFLIKCFQVTN